MKCPKCKTRMIVTHVYTADDTSSTQRLSCPQCNQSCTSVVLMVVTDPIFGQGAYKMAATMRKNKNKLKKLQKQIADTF